MTRQELFDNIRRKQTFLCVGLDTDIKKIPPHLLQKEEQDSQIRKYTFEWTVSEDLGYLSTKPDQVRLMQLCSG